MVFREVSQLLLLSPPATVAATYRAPSSAVNHDEFMVTGSGLAFHLFQVSKVIPLRCNYRG